MKKVICTWITIAIISACYSQGTGGNNNHPPRLDGKPPVVSDKVFTVVEQMPEYPGGDEALMKFIQKSLQYPEDAREIGVQGRVVVGFVVQPDGSLDSFSVKQSVWPSVDREVLRVMHTIGTFTPGRQQGKNVRVYFVMPVMMKLSGGDFTPLLNPAASDMENKANVLCSKEKFSKALGLYKTICEENPGNNFAAHNLGVCLYKTGDLAAAAAIWKKMKANNFHTADFLLKYYCSTY